MTRRPVDAGRVRALLQALANAASGDATVYLVGGASAVTVGWRQSTIDVDVRIEPEDEGALRALPRLKVDLDTNVELASPLDFLPALPGWRDRSPFVATVGRLTVRHFDPYSQALAKLARAFEQDVADVKAMVALGMVDPVELLGLFEAIAEELYRFPAIDAASLRASVMSLGGEVDPG